MGIGASIELAFALAAAGAKPPDPTPTRKRGRPRTGVRVAALRAAAFTLLTEPPPKKRGRHVKITPDDAQWFLAEIDTWNARRVAQGLKANDGAALRSSIRSYYLKKYRAEGRPMAEAKRLAISMANGPLFSTRKGTLSRLRSSARRKRR